MTTSGQNLNIMNTIQDSSIAFARERSEVDW